MAASLSSSTSIFTRCMCVSLVTELSLYLSRLQVNGFCSADRAVNAHPVQHF